MKPISFYGFQARDFAGFTLKSAHFRSFKTACISWFHLVLQRKVGANSPESANLRQSTRIKSATISADWRIITGQTDFQRDFAL